MILLLLDDSDGPTDRDNPTLCRNDKKSKRSTFTRGN